MIMRTQCVGNWHLIRNRQMQRMLKDNIRENKHRIAHEYSIGDLVLIRNDEIKSKLSKPTFGPLPVIERHPNKSILTIARHGYEETISIRRLIPFKMAGLAWGRMSCLSYILFYFFLHILTPCQTNLGIRVKPILAFENSLFY